MSSRPLYRQFALLAATVALLGAALAVPITAANVSVTGSLTYSEPIALTPQAVAIVTMIDQTAAADAGAVVGQQRIDAPTQVPIDFSVLVDAGTIDPTHSYALFATIVDGPTTWQNAVGEPVMTGGPSRGVDLVLTALPSPGALVGGTLLPPSGTVLNPSAVAIAALVKVETGTLVARQTRPVTDPADLTFSIGFDPSLIDPASTYVVKGGIVLGSSVWQNREGVTAIENGAAIEDIQLRAHAGSDRHPGGIVPTRADADPDRNSRTDRDPDADIRSQRERRTHGHADADTDSHADADSDTNADTDPDARADRVTDADSDTNPDADADADTRPLGRADAVADHRPGDRDVDLPRAVHPHR